MLGLDYSASRSPVTEKKREKEGRRHVATGSHSHSAALFDGRQFSGHPESLAIDTGLFAFAWTLASSMALGSLSQNVQSAEKVSLGFHLASSLPSTPQRLADWKPSSAC